MKKIIFVLAMLCLLFVSACKKEDMGSSQMIDDDITANDTIGSGTFTSYDHGLQGKAILYTDATSGNKVLRLEDFNMTQGPDVYVFLSTTSSYSAANVIEVAHLTTGYTNSNINFDVTSTAYSSSHQYVLVYCVQYSSLFGYAQLQQ